MTDMPHVALGDKPNEKITRIVELCLHEHGDIVIGRRLTVQLCNRAIDWWISLGPEGRAQRGDTP